MKENWKNIEGYDGDYHISNLGRIKSKKNGCSKILKGGPDTGGYSHIVLSNKGECKTYLIHRLVAEYFIPNPENKTQLKQRLIMNIKNNIQPIRTFAEQLIAQLDELEEQLEPDIEPSQYWQWSRPPYAVFRLQSQIPLGFVIKYLNGQTGQYTADEIARDGVRLSDDQIEQALIEEYKRRGGGICSYVKQYEHIGKAKIQARPA